MKATPLLLLSLAAAPASALLVLAPSSRMPLRATLPRRHLPTAEPAAALLVRRAPMPICMASSSDETLVSRLCQRLWSIGWLSWWTQTILTVISAVLLLFAKSVMARPSPALVGGLVMALGGTGAAFCSMFWTWGYTRISVRLGRNPVVPAEAARRAAGALRKGMLLNLVAIGTSLVRGPGGGGGCYASPEEKPPFLTRQTSKHLCYKKTSTIMNI